jgi:hypothetical protein
MPKVLSILGKAVLLMQIAALSLIQGYVLKPCAGLQISNRIEGITSVLQHRCGCQPEKVASHTCCCYSGNCRIATGHKPIAADHRNGRKPSPSYISPLSCGCTEVSYGLTSENFKFIGAACKLSLYSNVRLFSPSQAVNPENLVFAPPVPPPEIALFAPSAVI